MTNQQLQKLADMRMAHDCAMNGYGGRNTHQYDNPAVIAYDDYRRELGLDVIEAEELTWPIIWQEMQA